jgi:hypothetical protein
MSFLVILFNEISWYKINNNCLEALEIAVFPKKYFSNSNILKELLSCYQICKANIHVIPTPDLATFPTFQQVSPMASQCLKILFYSFVLDEHFGNYRMRMANEGDKRCWFQSKSFEF